MQGLFMEYLSLEGRKMEFVDLVNSEKIEGVTQSVATGYNNKGSKIASYGSHGTHVS